VSDAVTANAKRKARAAQGREDLCFVGEGQDLLDRTRQRFDSDTVWLQTQANQR
jgi:hypothetical protein